MSAHLQRLFARVAPVGASMTLPSAVPVAGLASPLAEADQRLGMPEFDGLMDDGTWPAEAGAQMPITAEAKAPTSLYPAAPRGTSMSPEVRPTKPRSLYSDRPPVLPMTAKHLDNDPAPARSILPMPSPVFDIDASDFAPAPIVDSPLSAAMDDAPSVDPTESGTGYPLPAPLAELEVRTRVDRAMPRTVGRNGKVGRDFVIPPAIDRAPMTDAFALPRPVDRGNMIEQNRPAASPAWSPSAEPAFRPEEDLQPATETRVEVVPIDPPRGVPEPARAEPAGEQTQSRPSQPLSAAAASRIGALPSRRSSVMLFGMRRR